MIGGIVESVDIKDDRVVIAVRDEAYNDRQTRTLKLCPASRCIGVGDHIWWQMRRYYWTPQGSSRLYMGKDRDIKIDDA